MSPATIGRVIRTLRAPRAGLAAHRGGRGRRRAAGSLPGPRGVHPLAPDPGRHHARGRRAAVPRRGIRPTAMRRLPAARIARLIFPVGFYRTKARVIRDHLSGPPRSVRRAGSRRTSTPSSRSRAWAGRPRTSSSPIGFGKPGICVDIHVHRISNRLGFVRTDSPDRDGAGAAREASALGTGSATTTSWWPSARTCAGRSRRTARAARWPRRATASAWAGPAEPARAVRRSA